MIIEKHFSSFRNLSCHFVEKCVKKSFIYNTNLKKHPALQRHILMYCACSLLHSWSSVCVAKAHGVHGFPPSSNCVRLNYRVSHEIWQLVKSFKCLLPHIVLDIKDFFQIISLKKCLTSSLDYCEINFTII